MGGAALDSKRSTVDEPPTVLFAAAVALPPEPSTRAGHDAVRFTLPQWALLAEALLPLALGLVLNLLRPDLMQLFLHDKAGDWITRVVFLAVALHLALEAASFVRLNRSHPTGTPGRRRRMTVIALACILCLNLPATLSVGFGPMVVAFNVAGPAPSGTGRGQVPRESR